MNLKCHKRFDLGNRRGLSRKIDVVDESGADVPEFLLMCECLDSDVQSAEGSGAWFLRWTEEVECGKLPLNEFSGNGWTVHVTPEKVWFEGLHSQGEGGAVSFNQFKFALMTFIRHLADPHLSPIEVEFPSH